MKRAIFWAVSFVFLGGIGSVAPAHAEVPEAYRKAWNDPALVKRIDDGIERNRKGEVTLRVVDAAGKPVSGAALSIRQKTHDFLFGCNAFVLGQLETPERNRQYEETLRCCVSTWRSTIMTL